MSTLPPQPLPPETTNGAAPNPWAGFDAIIEDVATAVRSAARASSSSQEPDAKLRCAQAALALAQTAEALLPAKADPAASLKVQGEMVKAGSQQAHDASQAELQREHDQMKLVQQAAVQQTTDNGATDGNHGNS